MDRLMNMDMTWMGLSGNGTGFSDGDECTHNIYSECMQSVRWVMCAWIMKQWRHEWLNEAATSIRSEGSLKGAAADARLRQRLELRLRLERLIKMHKLLFLCLRCDQDFHWVWRHYKISVCCNLIIYFVKWFQKVITSLGASLQVVLILNLFSSASWGN